MVSEQVQALISLVLYLFFAWWVLANTRDEEEDAGSA